MEQASLCDMEKYIDFIDTVDPRAFYMLFRSLFFCWLNILPAGLFISKFA